MTGINAVKGTAGGVRPLVRRSNLARRQAGLAGNVLTLSQIPKGLSAVRLPISTRWGCCALLGALLSGCNASLPFVRDEALAAGRVAKSDPSETAGSAATKRGTQQQARVLFDSEYDSFDSSESSDTLAYALSLTGTRYRYGGTTPAEGFDCSGFVRYVFGHFGVELPRSAREMAAALPKVDADERRPGDLVFFNTNGKPFSHVGIYLGNGRFVHATSSRTKLVMVSELSDSYWSKRLNGVRRPPAEALALSLIEDPLFVRL
jgi:cell wall-associated NlpC family hydrolase